MASKDQQQPESEKATENSRTPKTASQSKMTPPSSSSTSKSKASKSPRKSESKSATHIERDEMVEEKIRTQAEDLHQSPLQHAELLTDHEDLYQCPECFMKFLTKELLEEHYIKHTGMDLYHLYVSFRVGSQFKK